MTQDQAIEELKKFKELLDINAITQEEYDAKKMELMPLLMAKKPEHEETVKPTVSQPSSNPTVQKKDDSSSIGCIIFVIIAIVILGLVMIVSNSGYSSSNSGSSKAKTETSFSDVKTLSQYDFEERIKKVLRDPDSYQRIDYKVQYVSGDNYKATLTFRAKNGFGGMNICTYQGDLIWKKGSSKYSLGHITEIE